MSFVHAKPMTPQVLLDALSDLYSSYYFHGGKTDVQFDAMDQAGIAMGRAKRELGLTLKCVDLKCPEPPKPDLPLFNAFD